MSSGSWLRRRRRASAIVCPALLGVLATPARARAADLTLPPSTLDQALLALAREGGVDISSTERGLAAVPTRPVRAASVPAALRTLLRDTGYRAEPVPGGGFRVVRGPVRDAAVRAAAPAASAAATVPVADVVVTGSKQRVPLLRYPGSVLVVLPAGAPATAGAGSDLSDFASRTPILQTTELGPGRNKIFIRGVADSSFNGAAQSTASVYLDDVQIGFSGPDPGLKLYDMREIAVLEGPQGTLYGSGAIGGIVRLTSNPVDLGRWAGSLAGSISMTERGAPGYEVAGVVNVPLVDDTLGLRAVGYRTVEGGFVDDARRGLEDINRVLTVGGRLAVRAAPGDGWRIELAGAGQKIAGRDAQYADPAVGLLARASVIPEPYRSTVAFGRLLIEKEWDSGLQLVSATGAVATTSFDQFDASTATTPTTPGLAYRSNGDKLLTSHETRLSRTLPGTSWVVGVSLLRDRDVLTRQVSMARGDVDIIGVTNLTRSASAFGEATQALFGGLSLTAGARVTLARTDGDPTATPRAVNFVRGRSTHRVDPTAALVWQVAPAVAVFARYQSGYRTGGLAVAQGIGRVADFTPDTIHVEELGIRKLARDPRSLQLTASLSFAHWTNIQADLVSGRGQPYVANIGDARLQTFEATAAWSPWRGLRLDGAVEATHNEVTGALALLTRSTNRRLPETPAFAGRGGIGYDWRTGSGVALSVAATGAYTGPSVLGVGTLLDQRQGGYGTAELSGAARWRRYRVTLGVANATDTRGDRFAYGNPFLLAARRQLTPLRPLTVTLGGAVTW